MIWVKRLAPIVVIVLMVLGYRFYSGQREKQELRQEETYALAAAQVWVASAVFRDQPEHFLAYRESLLTSYGLDDSTFLKISSEYRKDPDKLLRFSRLLEISVDSLIAIEDSIAHRYDSAVVDSGRYDTTRSPQTRPDSVPASR